MPPGDPPEPVDLDLDSLSCAEFNPVPSEGRLLTRSQYNNTVRDLFHGRLNADYSADFPAENQVMGFSTNAEFHRASPLLTERQMTAAEHVARDVMPHLAELLPCLEAGTATAVTDQECAEAFIDEYGSRAFRRPMTTEERAIFVDLFSATYPRDRLVGSLSLVIQALLQSPQFLYRLEFGGEQMQVAGAYELSDHELASRLSYFLWNSMPDEELFAAARAGSLTTEGGIAEQARRMLDEPMVRDGVADFYRQWLKLERLEGVARDLDGTPTTLGESFSYSLSYFVTHVFSSEGGGLDALMTSPTVFLNDQLAPLYGVDVPADVAAGQFFRVEMDPLQRSGLLTQPGLMALYAHPDQSAPIQRGVFVRDAVLCQPAPAPPPSVDNNPPDPDPNLTTRERFRVHTEDAACASCHSLIDPIGLSFEGYDQLGRYREMENGLPVDVSGDVVGTREEEIRGPFDGAAELAQRFASSRQVRECVVTQWYRYGLGRVEQDVDLCSIARASDHFTAENANMKELLVAIVLSDAFRYRAVAEELAE